MTKQIHLYRTVSFLLIIILFFHTSFLTASAKCSEQSEQNFIQEDNYRKTLCKGFLGKSYGAVVDGIRCDCSGYTKAALERMNSQNNLGSFKDYYVKARCTNAWVAGSHISFTNGQIIDGSMQWNKKKTTAKVGKNNKTNSKLNSLELGDVVVYGKGSSSTHIAIYFGEFESAKEVANYLTETGVYSKNELKKSGSEKYTYKGRTVIRQYSDSKYWRIHATNSGILIDNDIKNNCPYTASFGKWKWTFSSGIQTFE